MIENILVDKLKELNYTISFAESCTGGLLASTIINVSGSSSVIKESYVTYSEEAKMKILGVNKNTLEKYTVYSKEVALEMAKGLKKISNSNVCVSVTGIAESDKNECCCYYCMIINDEIIVKKYITSGTRNVVRSNYAIHILGEILEILS